MLKRRSCISSMSTFLAIVFAVSQASAGRGALPYTPETRKLELPKDCPNDPSGLSCYIAGIPASADNIYQACQSNPETFEQIFKQPQFQHYMRADGKAAQVARREQFKMILQTEMNYTSRIPADSALFQKSWQDLKARWLKRAQENPEILSIDKDSLVAPDRCGVHFLLGLPCGEQPEIQFFAAKQDEAAELSKNEAVGRPYKWSLTTKLLKYKLLKSLSESESDPGVDMSKANPQLKALLAEERKFPVNTVFRDFPELAFSHALNNELLKVAVNSGLMEKLSREVYDLKNRKKSGKQHVSFYEKALLIEKAMSDVLRDHPLPAKTEAKIEKVFYQEFSTLMASFNTHFEKSKLDRQWVFTQDYLLGSYIALALARKDTFSAGVMQTIICHNAISQQHSESQKEVMLAIGGIIALGTGIGAMLASGTYAVALMALSFGMMNVVSAVDVYSAYKTQAQTKYEFLYNSTEFSKLDEAHKSFIKTLPWAFLNVALVSPIFLMKQIAASKRVAQAAGDTQKLARLALYEKTMSGSMFAFNAGITAMNAEPGYEAFLRIMKTFKEKIDGASAPNAGL